MKTIEELFNELAHRWEPLPTGDGEERLRAFALAVLEAAFDHRYVEITKGSDAHRLAMRAEIARLGE